MGRSATPEPERCDGKWRDLLWYTAAAGAAVGLAPSAVQAQVVTVDIDEFIEDSAIFVDLDDDGDAEFELNEDDLDNNGNPRDYTRFYQAPENPDFGEGPDTVTGLIGEIVAGYDYPLPLDVGVTVGPDSEFQDYYLNTFTFQGEDPNGWLGTEAYVGMRIALDDGAGNVTTHYGWALVEIPAQGGAIIAISAAYNATPDAPIVTGDTGTSNEDDAVVTGTHRLSDAYPNPFFTEARFDLTVARAQHVKAELYNVLGQRVAILFEGALSAESPHAIAINKNSLPSGLYVVRVAGETFTDSFRVTLAK